MFKQQETNRNPLLPQRLVFHRERYGAEHLHAAKNPNAKAVLSALQSHLQSHPNYDIDSIETHRDNYVGSPGITQDPRKKELWRFLPLKFRPGYLACKTEACRKTFLDTKHDFYAGKAGYKKT